MFQDYIQANGFGRMKILCDILDKKEIKYDWYVLGTAFDTKTLNEIQGIFKENKNVHFLGYKDNVYPYIKQMDYLALLTDRESWGLVITEALMLGVPVISTNFVGVENQKKKKKNGIIIDMENINHSYEKSVDDIIKLKEKLKENVKNKQYNKESIINRWKEILNN